MRRPASNVLFIRADGSARIGTGHMMRCLALAQTWNHAGGQVVWGQSEITPALAQQLEVQGIDCIPLSATAGSDEDASLTVHHARAAAADWIVADGYHFGAAWQKKIKDAGFHLLVIDDYGHANHYHADLILNQNASTQEKLYVHRDAATRLLLGTRYALLRSEFLRDRNTARINPPIARKILVTLGGSDPDNVTAKVIEALAQLSDFEAIVVLGGSNPNLEAVKRAIGPSNPSIHLVVNVTNMPELMAWADVAIAAAGSTSWELACMGLPSLLIITADNQASIAETLDRGDVSVSLGGYHTLTAEKISRALLELMTDWARRQNLSDNARGLVDGDGSARVVTHLRATQIKLRRADKNDCMLFWKWVNDPAVRSAAFNSETISWEQHQRWFHSKLTETDALIFVSSDADGKPIGQVRFEWDDDEEAEISVTVDANLRRSGVGPAIIRRSVDELFATTQIAAVTARIKKTNPASIRAFQKAGFTRMGATNVCGHEAITWILCRMTNRAHVAHDGIPRENAELTEF